jgi:outer membrane protein OmpA-like peptidoglycan-associated protein
MSFIGFIVILVFLVICVPFSAHRIESDIYVRVREALSAEVLPATGLVVEGRDVYLSGPVPSQEVKNRAERAVLKVDGVRTVRNFLVVQDPFRHSALVQEAQKDLDELLRGRRVEFEGDTDALTLASRAVLDGIAAILKRHSEVSLQLRVHTDWLGDDASSVKLSERRASVIIGYLRRKAVPGKRLSATALGAGEPVAPHSTPEGRLLNPRVELRLT